MRHTDDFSPTPSPSDKEPPSDAAAEPYRDDLDPAASAQAGAQSQSLAPRSATATGEPPAAEAIGSTERITTDAESMGWDVTWDPQPGEGEWTRTRPLPRLAVVPAEPELLHPEPEPIRVESVDEERPGRRQPWGLYALIGLLVVLAGVFFGFQVAYAGRVYPGVSMVGVTLDGKTRAEAADALRERVRVLGDREITLNDGDRAWALDARDLGLQMDPDQLAGRALLYGREGPIPLRLAQQAQGLLGSPAVLDPGTTTDQRVLDIQIARLAGQIDQPALDATLSIRDDGAVVAAAAQVG